MSKITWTNSTRRLRELVPWAHNPRRMSKTKVEALKVSLERFGLAIPLLISPDNEIYDGHQRQAVMAAMREYGPDAIVDVRVSSRKLTEDERRELVIRIGQIHAEWNFDELANLYEPQELLDWGFEQHELEALGIPILSDDEIVDENDDESPYTPVVETPIYTPTSPEPPPISALFDDSHARALIATIQSTPDLPDDLRHFLTLAAYRHVVFNFRNIAEYYAHAPKHIQTLFEQSALVILDIDRAIELNFVRLVDVIAKIYQEEYGNN